MTAATYSPILQRNIENTNTATANILVRDVNNDKHTGNDIRVKYADESPKEWDRWLESYNGLLPAFEKVFCAGIAGKDIAEIGVWYGTAMREICEKYKAKWHGVGLDKLANTEQVVFEKQDINLGLPLSRRHHDMDLIYSFRSLFYSPSAPDLIAQAYAMLTAGTKLKTGGTACLHLGYRGQRDPHLLKQMKEANPGLNMAVFEWEPLEYKYPVINENGEIIYQIGQLYPQFLQLYKYEGAPLYMDIPPYKASQWVSHAGWETTNSEIRYSYTSVPETTQS